MEYYGKILCISYNDLTYDDRPVIVNGKVDYSHSRCLNGVAPSMLPADTLAPIMSIPNYKQLSARGQINVVRLGKGLGNYALIEIATLPQRFKNRIKAKYGEMEQNILKDWFGQHYRIDAEARSFYTRFRFEDGSALPPGKINEYTMNASVLKAVVSVMADTNIMRKAMNGQTINWGEMSGAISYYKAEFGHTLPLSPHRFRERVNAYQKEGYESLISKKFKNQNTRKVNYRIERLLLSLDSQPERPYNTTVAEMYNMFVMGELQVADPEIGELFVPLDFVDKKGNPIVLSEATIANYLNTPKNKALRAKLHDTQWDFNNHYRPYHLRAHAVYSLSKISLDDRDLPRPMHNGQRVKAYYAYDVVSGAVVGYSYNRLKTRDLFLDCMRNMFQTLDRNSFYMPAELEVEHHLVENFADGLMKAGVVFPLIRWCNPGNSREKRAEHFNRAKKYGVEKRLQVGVGRWYARLEANRPKVDKVYDEQNNTYKEKSYSCEELVADDIRAIQEYNNQLHPNQKMYPGMTRWDVLAGRQNPDLRPFDKAVLYRFIGEHTSTTIKQNMYCTVQYQQYRLPSPEVIDRLAPRNMKVDAYWLADGEGNVKEVYLYQNGEYICTCGLLERYNEATAEQTVADHAAYTEQAKYVSQFDKMMKDGKIQKVVVMKNEDAREIEQVEARVVSQPVEQPDEDYSDYMDTARYKREAVGSL
ncbi:MAG: hypothetical protein K2J84_06310 [Bacteroidaceae bacterium]|nr:hypothetical protein [Bacteroidaceae bacterium]